MDAGPEPLTLNGGARASNAGLLDVQPLAFARSFPRWPFVFGAALAAGAVAALLVHWLFWIVVLSALLGGYYFWVHVEEHFLFGCVNPARVVSTDPPRIAVFTDLRRGWKPYPAIRVLDQPLRRMTGGLPSVGDRLGTVALYEVGESRERWETFNPVVANCVTRSHRDLERVLRSIPAEEWEWLDEGLRQIPTPTTPGLYFLDPAAPPHPGEQTVPVPRAPEGASPGRAVKGLRLVLPSAPLAVWAAGLMLLAERVVIGWSLPAGLLVLAAGFAMLVYADCGTQERLNLGGWPRHPLPMRGGYWLMGMAGALDALSDADGVSASLARSTGYGALALTAGGILLVWSGQNIWYGRLDRLQRTVVDHEMRRYRRLIFAVLAGLFLLGIGLAVQRRMHQRSRPGAVAPGTAIPAAPQRKQAAPGQSRPREDERDTAAPAARD